MVTQVFGMFVIGSGVVSGILWLYVALTVNPWITSGLHRAVVSMTIAAFLLIDLVVIASATAIGPEAVRALFGVAMGLQMVAGMAAVLLVRRRRL